MMKTNVLIAGCGCAGLYCALNLPQNLKVTIITKSDEEKSDSYLAQGGMCVQRDDADFKSFFEDTMRSGHFENDETSVEIMINSSRDVLDDLVSFGADFEKNEDGSLIFTREGAHSEKRIVFHEDVTGKEITSTLLKEAKKRKNIEILEYTTLLDIIEKDEKCIGAIIRKNTGEIETVESDYTVLATGGAGGLYKHTTNYRHLTADGVAISAKHNIRLRDITYVQIHPTTLYSNDERSFLISESVRGEGAVLRDKNGKRFTNELAPRDVLTKAIKEQMEKDGTDFVWEDLTTIDEKTLKEHFPNILAHCKEKGYDATREWIPVVPSQHYFMGGVWVDYDSKTSLDKLYAVGETACNGVHGKNRLASNSLLESLVFSKRAAKNIEKNYTCENSYEEYIKSLSLEEYKNQEKLEEEYYNIAKKLIREGNK